MSKRGEEAPSTGGFSRSRSGNWSKRVSAFAAYHLMKSGKSEVSWTGSEGVEVLGLRRSAVVRDSFAAPTAGAEKEPALQKAYLPVQSKPRRKSAKPTEMAQLKDNVFSDLAHGKKTLETNGSLLAKVYKSEPRKRPAPPSPIDSSPSQCLRVMASADGRFLNGEVEEKEASLYVSPSLDGEPDGDLLDLQSPSAGTKGKKKASAKKASSSVVKKKKKVKRLKQNIDESLSGESSSSVDAGKALLLMFDSGEAGEAILDWLLAPMPKEMFFRERWETTPLHIRRDAAAVEGIFSTKELDRILRQCDMEYGSSVDLTQYIDGKRRTLNPTGKVYAPVVWDHYNQGCSVRLRDPAAHSEPVWRLCSLLQEPFASFVGANVYLTPPGTQGFAPHWDDIDAFILQLEGAKHWRVYAPRSEEETHPRDPSENFSEADLPKPPELEVWLRPGDFLYLPRGWIHQGDCAEDEHSLHITLSVCQSNTWADLFQKLLPTALELTAESNRGFRRSLPRNYLDVAGIANQPEEGGRVPRSRAAFLSAFKERLEALSAACLELADSAADQMAKDFLHGALPPLLTENEKCCSIVAGGEVWDPHLKQVDRVTELQPETRVKLLRRHILRLCEEGEPAEKDCVRVYHSAANTRNFKEKEPQYFDIPENLAAGVDFLLETYPDYVAVEELEEAGLNTADQMRVCEELYQRGLLITEEPLEPTYDFE